MRDLDVITPPASEPVTVAEAKAHSRILNALEDSYVEGLIVAARQLCEHWEQRTYMPTTFLLTLDHFPYVIKVPRPPLRAVVSIEYVDGNGDPQTLVEDTDYLVVTRSTPGRITPVYGRCWPSTRCQPGAVSVTFTAGYDDAASVPAATRHAIKMQAAHLYEHREAVAVGAMSEVPMAVRSLLSINCWGNYS